MRGPGSGGFTLLELVVVIAVTAILAVTVGLQLRDSGRLRATAFAGKLRADVRFAQSVAMTGGRRTRVYVNGVGTAPASGYAVAVDASASADCTAFAAVRDPAGSGPLSVALGSGQFGGISILPAAPPCLEYDTLGRPYDCTAAPGACSATPSGASFAVRSGAAVAATVLVAADTGAVD